MIDLDAIDARLRSLGVLVGQGEARRSALDEAAAGGATLDQWAGVLDYLEDFFEDDRRAAAAVALRALQAASAWRDVLAAAESWREAAQRARSGDGGGGPDEDSRTGPGSILGRSECLPECGGRIALVRCPEDGIEAAYLCAKCGLHWQPVTRDVAGYRDQEPRWLGRDRESIFGPGSRWAVMPIGEPDPAPRRRLRRVR